MANKYASIVQSGVYNYLTSAELLNNIATNTCLPGIVGSYTNTSGVAPSTGNFAVNAQGSPNMTVAVSSGKAYVSATPTSGNAQTVEVRSDATENVTIAANSTGSTRYDFVYLKVDADKMNNPSVAGTDVVTLTTQRSTTQNVDSNGALSNALLLAIVTVINGASSIANSYIYDARIQSSRNSDGWVSANETWAYASSTTITVPSGATGKYSVGDKIRIYQANTLKYFYVTGVTSTVLTVTGGSDYTVANSTILNPCYSKATSPVGFPQWFNFTPSWSNLTAGNATQQAMFSMIGKKVTCAVNIVFGSTSSMSTNPSLTLPVTASSTMYGASGFVYCGNLFIVDSGTTNYQGYVRMSSTTAVLLTVGAVGGTYQQENGITSTVPMTWTTNDQANLYFSYQAA